MLNLAYRFLFPAMWLVWALYWWLASFGGKATQRREHLGSRLLHVLPLAAAIALLWPERVPFRVLNQRVFPWAPWEFWVAAFVTAAGLGFAVWARRHIGRNWSGTVTLKRDHELIVTGPYAFARHPIYTGLLVAIVGSALARGEWRGLLAIALAWAALWRKLLLEEQWMLELFGDQYAEYRRRVPALIPFSRSVAGASRPR
ncbi:MAG TPA: isoprenylcysteine carboxylmethyltransferase family protein [Burkholderiaceae bacterium]|nr:isoprenylcysteine carboxylmethyltransferase family protein [Burkholderiaceae bacterium]